MVRKQLTLEGLERLDLARGAHSGPDQGACLMEAAAWMAGEAWSDHPACVSPVLAAFGRSLNDRLDHERRQSLKPLVPMLIGTVDPAADRRDGLRCAHHLVSVWTPAWLDLVPTLADHANGLRALPLPVAWDDVRLWQPALAAAGDAARAAAGDAAGDAAWDAAGAAARDAARDAAGAAAWAAAWDAAGAAAGAAARDAAGAAARDAVQPTSDTLRDGIISLFAELVETRR